MYNVYTPAYVYMYIFTFIHNVVNIKLIRKSTNSLLKIPSGNQSNPTTHISVLQFQLLSNTLWI